MTPIVRFESVSKRYRLRHERPRSFQEVFTRGGGARRPPPSGVLWALRDVTFDVEPGETVGLIGPNGAGKSTALKLISRVIVPTAGRVVVNGRVGALLELGAGFHPDLSGRDNVYLSGALAGMTRPEIARKYDAIVAFSELEPFIDMPVKHYSSGMFARLAFAVNVHLDPDLLLVDEVLAVGDHAFQNKCLDRIAELRLAGVTVCLVSHSGETIRSLCSRAIWFERGQMKADGHPEPVVLQYLEHATQQAAQRRLAGAPEAAAPGSEAPIYIAGVRLLDAAGHVRQVFATGERFTLEVEYAAGQPVESPVFGMAIHRHDGVHITGPNTAFAGLTLPTLHGRGRVRYTVPALPLLEGLYHVTVAVVNRGDTRIYDYHDRLYPFRVANPGGAPAERYGLMTLGGEWEHVPEAI